MTFLYLIIVFFPLNYEFILGVCHIDKKKLYLDILLFFIMIIKGIVHPKMKILSLITHPDVVPNL